MLHAVLGSSQAIQYNKDSLKIVDRKNSFRLDSLKKIDFIHYRYKYLDENFKIKISSQLFEETVVKHKFYKERITRHKDSIGVVLMTEFNDDFVVNFIKNRICFSWQRLGYHLWLSSLEAENLGKSIQIGHPYLVYEFILKNSITNEIIRKFIADLKIKMIATDVTLNFDNYSIPKLLSTALRLNSQRIKDFNDLVSKRKY